MSCYVALCHVDWKIQLNSHQWDIMDDWNANEINLSCVLLAFLHLCTHSDLTHLLSCFRFQPMSPQDVSILITSLRQRARQAATHHVSPLRSLVLEGCGLQPTHAEDILKALSESGLASQLICLDLENNSVDSRACAVVADHLMSVGCLQSLRLSHNPDISDDGAVLLASALRQSSLQHLSLDGCELSDVGVCSLASALPGSRLQTLQLDFQCGVGLPGAAALANAVMSSALTTLSLRGTAVHSDGLNQLLHAINQRNASEVLPAFMYRGPGEASLAISTDVIASYSDDSSEDGQSSVGSGRSHSSDVPVDMLPPTAWSCHRSDDEASQSDDVDYQRIVAAAALLGDFQSDDEK
jgi:Ran GTPase-activating protein (RanGAP) involved in mRNA processing and transport